MHEGIGKSLPPFYVFKNGNALYSSQYSKPVYSPEQDGTKIPIGFYVLIFSPSQCNMCCEFWKRQETILQNLPDRLWGSSPPPIRWAPHSFPDLKGPEWEVKHSPASNVEFKNEWSFTSTPPTFLYGVERDNFNFLPLDEHRDNNLTFKYATLLSSQNLPYFLTLNIFLFYWIT